MSKVREFVVVEYSVSYKCLESNIPIVFKQWCTTACKPSKVWGFEDKYFKTQIFPEQFKKSPVKIFRLFSMAELKM